METQFIIALTSIITSTFTVFLSNFLAPRINARYERKYRDDLILKKTLRILMEIEIYVQRNLKLPSLSYYFESIVPKLRKLGHVNDEQVTLISASFPQLVQTLQSQAVQVLPDKSEELDKEFALILNELSTVDPLLAYRISERHIITPIQKMDSVLGEMLRGLGIDTKKDELEIQLLNQFASSQKSKMIDELLSDLRKDILKVATKIGKGTLSEIELYFSELDIKRRKQAENMAGELVKLLPKKVQDAKS